MGLDAAISDDNTIDRLSRSQAHPSERFALHSERLGPLPLVNHFLERMGMQALLERYIPTADRRSAVTHAQALGVLRRSILVEREPVYRQHETVDGFAAGKFGIDAAQMQRFTDDRIGRALDRLFDADRAALLTEVVVAVGQRFGVAFDRLHNDSTSIALCGQYRSAGGRTLRSRSAPAITFGFSKDHRPGSEAVAVHPHRDRRGGASLVSLRRRQHQRLGHPRADLGGAARGGRARRLPVRGRLQAVLLREHAVHRRRGRALRDRDAAHPPGGRVLSQVDPDSPPGLGARLRSAQCPPQRRPAGSLVRLSSGAALDGGLAPHSESSLAAARNRGVHSAWNTRSSVPQFVIRWRQPGGMTTTSLRATMRGGSSPT
ncbi:MAG: DUF4277 domain-containing protein, partial [Burkholderiales bacterium]|nr:DUF4277 domain-containing protein [Burkholderiales bacterium]